MGCEGLNNLLRDPRYLNDDPEHKRVVAMVGRAFELVFDETPENRRRLGRAEPDAFTRTLEQRVGDEAGLDRLPRDERAGLGRELLVRALKDDGVKLPGGVPEREPPPAPPPLARLGAPTDAQRRNASARPQAERRPARTLLADGEGPDDLAGVSGNDRVASRHQEIQVAQGRPIAPPRPRPIPTGAGFEAAREDALRDDIDRQERLSRGIRNNNPGNIVHSADRWDGMAAVQSDPDFVTFDSPQMGIRAMGVNLRTYRNVHNIRTVDGIITKWAREPGKSPDPYIRHVVQLTGFHRNQVIDVTDRATLAKLINAMITHENGGNPYRQEVILEGVDMALP